MESEPDRGQEPRAKADPPSPDAPQRRAPDAIEAIVAALFIVLAFYLGAQGDLTQFNWRTVAVLILVLAAVATLVRFFTERKKG